MHPTGFVDPADADASTKVLCGEMMRGVGGILLTPGGSRFVNELAPRDAVVAAEAATGAAEFVLLLNGPAADEAGKHVELYTRKGLLTPLRGTPDLARWMVASGGEGTPPDAAALERTKTLRVQSPLPVRGFACALRAISHFSQIKPEIADLDRGCMYAD